MASTENPPLGARGLLLPTHPGHVFRHLDEETPRLRRPLVTLEATLFEPIADAVVSANAAAPRREDLEGDGRREAGERWKKGSERRDLREVEATSL